MDQSVDGLLKEISILEQQKSELLKRLSQAEESILNIQNKTIEALLPVKNKADKTLTVRLPDHTYRVFLEKIQEAAVILDTRGFILYSNTKFASLVDMPLSTAIGSDFHSVLHAECLKKFERFLMISCKKNIRAEFSILTGAGKLLPVLFSGTRLHLQDSDALGIAVTDLTWHKQEEKELQLKNQLLKTSNNELANFAYIASHDLQEPLRTITNYLGLFQRKYTEKLDDQTLGYLVYINEATTRMRELINDLLEYSRIGRNDANMVKIDCNLLLQTVLKDISAVIQENKAIIKAEPLPTITGYYIEIKSLFQNLISNAVKFRKKEQDPVILIGSEEKEQEYVFSVKDNGIGIEKKYYERIFIIFQRLHTRAEYPGTGIGLAFCKKIVELHKGRIWVESKPGIGSTFYFTLPKNSIK